MAHRWIKNSDALLIFQTLVYGKLVVIKLIFAANYEYPLCVKTDSPKYPLQSNSIQ